jgi:hypothetical protein
MDNIFTRKQRLSCQHFSKNAPNTPNVNGRCILHFRGNNNPKQIIKMHIRKILVMIKYVLVFLEVRQDHLIVVEVTIQQDCDPVFM